MKNKVLKNFSCLGLTGLIIVNSILPTFAAIRNSKNLEMINIENNTNIVDINSMINELKYTQYDNDIIEPRSFVSSTIKKVAKWILNNKSKISGIIGKYIVGWTFGKNVTEYLEDIVDGVIEIDESIDEFIYNFVNMILPDMSYRNKKLIANSIRFALPF